MSLTRGACHVEPYLQPRYSPFVATRPSELQCPRLWFPSPEFQDHSEVMSVEGGEARNLVSFIVDLHL